MPTIQIREHNKITHNKEILCARPCLPPSLSCPRTRKGSVGSPPCDRKEGYRPPVQAAAAAETGGDFPGLQFLGAAAVSYFYCLG